MSQNSTIWPIVHNVQTSMEVVIALIGVIGNGCVTYVYGHKRTLSPTEKLILSISVVDLLSCLYFVVFPVLKTINDQLLPLEPCLVDQFIVWFIPLVSLFLMAAISINRLTAVCFPIQYPQLFSLRNVRHVLVGTLLYSASTGLSFSLLCFFYHSTFKEWEHELAFWTMLNKVATFHVITVYSLAVLGIVVSSLVTAASLNRRLQAKKKRLGDRPSDPIVAHSTAATPECPHKNQQPQQCSTSKSNQGVQNLLPVSLSSELNVTKDVDKQQNHASVNKVTPKDVKLTKALLIVAIAYVVLCSPYIAYNLLFRVFINLNEISERNQFLLKLTVTTLYIINYTINPFTYYYLNEFFHNEVSDLARRVRSFVKRDSRCNGTAGGVDAARAGIEERYSLDEGATTRATTALHQPKVYCITAESNL